jgi:hypothetical protein
LSFYTLSSKQLLVNSLLISLVTAGLTVGGYAAKEYYDLPTVFFNSKAQCIKVINYKNGDAFNCQDVDNILRRYRILKIDDTKDSTVAQ